MALCPNNHEIAAEQQFCGACGKPPVAEMVKCGACSAQFIKGPNFCGQCGAQQGDASKDLDVAIDTLAGFQKAHAAKAAALATLPTLEDVAVDQQRVDEILKSAEAKDAAGKLEGYDGTVLIPELLRDNAELRRNVMALGGMVKSYTGHLVSAEQANAEALNAVMGQVLAQGRFLKAFTEQFEKWANSSRGRVVERAFTMADRPALGGGAPNNANELRGPALMTKAQAAKGAADAPLFSAHEIAVLEHYTNQGAGVSDIGAARPELAARITQIAA